MFDQYFPWNADLYLEPNAEEFDNNNCTTVMDLWLNNETYVTDASPDWCGNFFW